jgi:branched-subunit amino acid aminotransferase/4-amino-4-deoxychorismate lyase
VAHLPFLDEAAMSSSSRALLPVVEIAGQKIGDGRPGPITQRILAAYNEYVERKVETAVVG